MTEYKANIFTTVIQRLARGDILSKEDVGQIFNSTLCDGPNGQTYEDNPNFHIYRNIRHIAINMANVQNIANLLVAPMYFDRAAPNMESALIYCAQFGSLKVFKYLISVIHYHNHYDDEISIPLNFLKRLARYNEEIRPFLAQYDSALELTCTGHFAGLFKKESNVPEVVFVNYDVGDKELEDSGMYTPEELEVVKSLSKTRIYKNVVPFAEAA